MTRVTGCGLRVTGCGLRVASCELRVAGCELRVAGYEARVTDFSRLTVIKKYRNFHFGDTDEHGLPGY